VLSRLVIDPGKPWQNDSKESFNGRLRAECLGVAGFRTRAAAKNVLETRCRPYAALGASPTLHALGAV